MQARNHTFCPNGCNMIRSGVPSFRYTHKLKRCGDDVLISITRYENAVQSDGMDMSISFIAILCSLSTPSKMSLRPCWAVALVTNNSSRKAVNFCRGCFNDKFISVNDFYSDLLLCSIIMIILFYIQFQTRSPARQEAH